MFAQEEHVCAHRDAPEETADDDTDEVRMTEELDSWPVEIEEDVEEVVEVVVVVVSSSSS